MSIADVREAMADALRLIPGLRASPYLTEQINTPHAMFDFAVVPDLVMDRGADVYNFTIQVYFQRTSERSAQILMDELREPFGSTSVKTVLENGANWPDDLIHYCRVTSIGRAVVVTVGAVDYLMVEFEAEVVF